MAGWAGPGCAQVHQRPAGHHTGREPCAAGRTHPAPVRYHRLAAGALRPVGPRILRAVLDKDVHGKLLVLLPPSLRQLLQRLQPDEGLAAGAEGSVGAGGEGEQAVDVFMD